jgi:hypothetical protein
MPTRQILMEVAMYPSRTSFQGWAVLTGLGALALLAVPAAGQSGPQRVLYTAAPPSIAERQRATLAIVRYIAAWNERDPKRRRERIAEAFTEDATYMDPNRHGVGYDEIESLMASAHRAFPPPYSLRIVSTISTHHDGYVRFSWAGGGMPDAPIFLAGTNFGKLAPDGRVESMIGFGDADAISLPARSNR